MEFDMKSCRMIYLIMDKYHSITDYRYRHDKQRFKIILYCRVENRIKRYPYMFVTEKQLIRDIIYKFRGKHLFRIKIEPIEQEISYETPQKTKKNVILCARMRAWVCSLREFATSTYGYNFTSFAGNTTSGYRNETVSYDESPNQSSKTTFPRYARKVRKKVCLFCDSSQKAI